MKILTFLKKHPEVQEFWVQGAKDETAFARFRRDDLCITTGGTGEWKVKGVEEPPEPGELYTLLV